MADPSIKLTLFKWIEEDTTAIAPPLFTPLFPEYPPLINSASESADTETAPPSFLLEQFWKIKVSITNIVPRKNIAPEESRLIYEIKVELNIESLLETQ